MRLWRYFLFSSLILIIPFFSWLTRETVSSYSHPVRLLVDPVPSPSPTYDPLAIPTLPAHPSEFEYGKYLYYYHCMPCHGDAGQGLTDTWRMVWEEDHRDCWGRGCHGGRMKDEGFPIPTVVPAIISSSDLLGKYPSLDSLIRYLHDTHPPQRPGKLKDDEYRALAVYLWVSNGRPLPDASAVIPAAQASLVLTVTPTGSPTATPAPRLDLPSPTPFFTPTPSPMPGTVLDARQIGLVGLGILVVLFLVRLVVWRLRRSP